MADYDTEGKIVLFKNDYHVEGEDNKPNLTGKLRINGVDYKVALWRGREGSSAVLNGNVQPMDDTYSKPAKVEAQKPAKPSAKPKAIKLAQELPANLDDLPF